MNLVTGATGFLGSYIAEKLVQGGQKVRALVRPTSNTAFIDTLGVEKVVGDLGDPASLERACRGVEVVYHTAAQVGDWGPWEAFQKHTIDATDNIARAAQNAGARRFLHVSSISAYGNPNGKNLVLDESAPLGANVHRWSYYTIAKVQAERNLWEMHRKEGFPLTVIRPSWIYGPRDRTSIARLHRMITTGKIKILGSGENRLNTVFAGNVADACMLAAGNEKAVGELYNCSNDGYITQNDFLKLWAEAFGCAAPMRKVPYGIAISAAFLCECFGRLVRMKKAPFITRYSVWLMGREVYFPADKARKELGWESQVSYEQGVKRTAEWYLKKMEALS